MAKQVVAALVGAALGVMTTTAIAISVRPKAAACEPCRACPPLPPPPQPQPQPQTPPPPAPADAGVAEADIDAGPDLGDLSCTMDEVGCLLADRPPACCSMYGNRHVVPAPTSLSASEVRTVVTRMRARFVRCGEESDKHGTVRATVKVAPDGKVTSVVIRDAPDDALAQCVATVMRSARFPRSDTGVTFTYPFVF